MSEMKKVVVKLNSLEEKKFLFLDGMIKKNPLQAASSIKGTVSMELNAKDNKITIIGDVDPVKAAKKLRKWYAKIESVGPAKEEKKEGDKKVLSEEEKKDMLLQYYKNYNNNTHYIQPCPDYCYEENRCVIC